MTITFNKIKPNKVLSKDYGDKAIDNYIKFEQTEISEPISDLIQENEKLKREPHQQRFNNKHNLSIDQKISDEIIRLNEENKKLRACIEFYAKIENWYDVEEIQGSDRRTIRKDGEDLFDELNYHTIYGGKLARQVLREIE